MRGQVIPYSSVEMEWLEANRSMVISDYWLAFVTAFGRKDVTAANLHSLRKRNGWKVGRAPGRFAGRSRAYSPDEMAWLQENCTLPVAEYAGQFASRFGRDVVPNSLHRLRKAKGWRTGRTGRFEKGQISHNKGKHCEPGMGANHPNSVATRFQKGMRPHTYRGPGHESVLKNEGYVVLTVDETNPWTGAATRQVFKHRWLWEKANGPVPAGHALKCLDGDKTNTDPSNWEAIPRALIPRLNGGPHRSRISYDEAPAELKPAILAVAKLEHRVRAQKRKRKPA